MAGKHRGDTAGIATDVYLCKGAHWFTDLNEDVFHTRGPGTDPRTPDPRVRFI